MHNKPQGDEQFQSEKMSLTSEIRSPYLGLGTSSLKATHLVPCELTGQQNCKLLAVRKQ